MKYKQFKTIYKFLISSEALVLSFQNKFRIYKYSTNNLKLSKKNFQLVFPNIKEKYSPAPSPLRNNCILSRGLPCPYKHHCYLSSPPGPRNLLEEDPILPDFLDISLVIVTGMCQFFSWPDQL